MWVLSLSLFFCFVSFAPALSSPINQGSVHPVTLLDVRDIDTGNTGVLATPGSLSDYRPPVPYTWAVPGATASYIRLTRYGKDILAEDGYLFMYVHTHNTHGFRNCGPSNIKKILQAPARKHYQHHHP